jgi:hypothetical protein
MDSKAIITAVLCEICMGLVPLRIVKRSKRQASQQQGVLIG